MRAATARRLSLVFSLIIMVEFGLVIVSHINLPSEYFERSGSLPASDLTFLAAIASFGFVGAFIYSRRPDHRIGWLCLFMGLYTPIAFAVGDYSAQGLLGGKQLPGADVAAWLTGFLFAPLVSPIPLILLLFPTGKIPSRRWRFVLWLVALALLVAAFGSVLVFPYRGTWMLVRGSLDRPKGAELGATFLDMSWPIVLLAMFAAGTSQIIRYRRARGEERQQLKLLALAVAFIAITITTEGVTSALFQLGEPNFFNLLLPLGLLLVPISMGVAILRYRLYDIDVVINKTFVYFSLAAFITLIYVGVVVGIGSVIGSGDEPNLGLSLAATALVAVAFQPVRERTQRIANRIVYGQRLSPYEAVTSFSHRIAESLSFDDVLPSIGQAAAAAVGGERAKVKLIFPQGGSEEIEWPSPNGPAAYDATVEVIHQGEQVGEISVAKKKGEALTTQEQKLVNDLASQAGLAFSNLRLTEELKAKLVELQESRRRIVSAQDEERRRMERDIHDGAQQQLVSMSVKLGLAQSLLAKDPEGAHAMLDELKAEAAEAVETLRDLARGLFPQVLADRGLRDAVASHIEKMGVKASISKDSVPRLTPEVETAIYFVIREALQNASKYASESQINVDLAYEEGSLVFAVKDRGPGFEPSSDGKGSGMQNMRDRIEALGGTFEIQSRNGIGTTVTGRVPTSVLGQP